MKRCFTLIELIVVIAIIAILAAIIAPNAFKAIEKAKVAGAISDFKAYKAAIYSLYSDTGRWVTDASNYFMFTPTNNNLMVNLSDWAGWDGPYLEKAKSSHPWSGSYYLGAGISWQGVGGTGIVLEYEDSCYPSGPNGGCPMPRNSALNIDDQLDDGVLTTGDFYGSSDYHWVLIRDLY